MIKSWRHKGLRLFYKTGSKAKINAHHADRLHDILQVLDCITVPEQINFPGLKLHKLSGDLQSFYALKVSENWRLIFSFDGQDVILVDYLDYH